MAKTFLIDKFIGLNNISPEMGLPSQFLVKAENVFITNDFTLKHSPGLTELEGTPQNCHSLKSFGNFCLFVSEGKLYRINKDRSIVQLFPNPVFQNDLPVDYFEITDKIYMTNGVEAYVYDRSQNTIFNFGIPLPNPPSIYSEQGGQLVEGIYRIAVSFVRRDWQESGLSDYAELFVSNGSKLTITLPAVNNTDIVDYNIYATKSNSGIFKFLRKVSVSSNQTVYLNENELHSLEPVTQNLEPLRLGNSIEFFNGRLWTNQANVLYYSELYAYELTNPENFIPLPDYILDIYSLGNILYINCVDGVYVINKDLVLRKVGTTHFVKGSGKIVDLYKFSFFEKPMSGIALLAISKEGVILGLMDGELINLTSRSFRFNEEYKIASTEVIGNTFYIIPKT